MSPLVRGQHWLVKNFQKVWGTESRIHPWAHIWLRSLCREHYHLTPKSTLGKKRLTYFFCTDSGRCNAWLGKSMLLSIFWVWEGTHPGWRSEPRTPGRGPDSSRSTILRVQTPDPSDRAQIPILLCSVKFLAPRHPSQSVDCLTALRFLLLIK
jgi:hypothetical protein